MVAWKNVWQGWIVLAMMVFVAPPTNAQSVDPQAKTMVQSLYEQAIGLMDEKNFAAACPKLEQATTLSPNAIGVRLGLGECYVGQGRFASAWAQYMKAEALAAAAGARETEAKAEARAEADKLEQKIVMVTITVSVEARNVPGLSVTWDGVEQAVSTWGTPMPVDLGKHVLEAKAPQRRSWSQEVNLEKGGASVEQKVPVLEPVPVEVKPTVREPVPVQVKPTVREPVHVETKPRPIEPPRRPAVLVVAPSRTWMRPAGITAVSVGAAGMIAGGVLGGVAISKLQSSNAKAEGDCDARSYCNAQGVLLRDETLEFATVSTVAVVAGGVLASGGLVLLIGSAPKKHDSAMHWHVEVTPMGLGLRGVW